MGSLKSTQRQVVNLDHRILRTLSNLRRRTGDGLTGGSASVRLSSRALTDLAIRVWLCLSVLMSSIGAPAAVSGPAASDRSGMWIRATQLFAGVGIGDTFRSLSQAVAPATDRLGQVLLQPVIRYAAPLLTATGGTAGALLALRNVEIASAANSNLTVYVGYADNLRASGFFPSPWQGSANVNFNGAGPSFDAGAVRIDNSSGSPATVDSVVVTIGSTTFNLWGSSLSVPANGSLILTQTTQYNFDTSDVSPGACTAPNGLIPQVTLTVTGVPTTFQDTQQVLNTGGLDLAACPSGTNESQPWSLLGGGLTPGQLNGYGSPAAPQVPQCNSGQPVNCATGNFWETYNELTIPGRGNPLNLSLTYNSLAASQNSPVGFGWSFTYGISLQQDPSTGNVTITHDNGSTVTFTPSGGGYTAGAWILATLVKNNDGTFSYTLRRSRQQFVFLSTGQLHALIDRNAYSTLVAYNGSQIATVTDPAGRALTFTYGTNGDIATVTDPASRQVSFGYDTSGNLTSITDEAGHATRFAFDSGHRLLTRTDPNGGVLTNAYDSQSRVTSQKDALNRTTTFSYLAGTTTITDPRGYVTQEHFSNLELAAITRGLGTAQEATWKYAYDPVTLALTSTTDPNGHTSTNTYSSQADLLSHADALNRTTTFTYDTQSDLTSVTDPLGVTTTYAYDSAGNLLSTSRPLVGSNSTWRVTLGYDVNRAGDVTSVTDANGSVWTRSYDAVGNLASVGNPLSNTTSFVYDPAGRATSQTLPRGGKTTFAYDAVNDLTSITDPLGKVTSQTWDANRNLLTRTDADGNLTSLTYDADNEQTKITHADNSTQSATYDANGNVLTQADANNNVTNYTFDPLNRVASSADPLNRTTSYAYDGVGNLTSTTNPSPQTTTLIYDAANQLTSITYSDGVTPRVNYTYDADGRRTQMVDGTGTTTYAYDSLNRLTSSTNGANQAVGYTYDLNSDVTALKYPNGQSVSRTYDAANRLTQVTDWASHSTSFGYDADSDITSFAFPNTVQTALTYDTADRLNQVSHTTSGTTLANFAYTRDPNGQLTSMTPTGIGSAETYTYSKVNELASVNGTAYSYDPAKNITKLLSGATLTYDAASEVTNLTQGGSTTTMTYDKQGDRLSGVTVFGAPASYSYDQANRLTKTTVQGSVKAIAAGEDQGLAIESNATAWAWGDNDYGELGATSSGTCTTGPCSLTPIQTTGLTGVAALASGYDHSLAAKSDGTIWAWGDNTYGELGNGTTTSSTTPVQAGGLSGVVSVAGGDYYSLALRTDGTVWAWGDGSYGQLGTNTTATCAQTTPCSLTPTQVSGVSGITAIAAGQDHSLALKTDGTVWAWGLNSSGQLGNGSTKNSATPVQVTGLTGVVAIAAGGYHSLAVKSDGTLWAWGADDYGQLGNGSTKGSSTPIQVSGLSGVAAIGGGRWHSLAVKTDGTVWAWGLNEWGQVGATTSATCSSSKFPCSTTPIQVTGLTGANKVAGGHGHSLALKTDGSVWAWGYDGDGELGDGTTGNSPCNCRTTPVQVSGLTGTTTTTYQYNGDGLRMSKSSPSGTVQFAWDQSSGLPLLLTDGSTSFIYGPGGTPIEQIDSSGNPTYLHVDQLGSTRLLTNSSGRVTGTYIFDPYGTTTSHTGSASTPLEYAGQYLDSETGLYYLRARYYDPTTDQLITRDPLFGSTQQPYSYVGDNPPNGVDPRGLYTSPIVRPRCSFGQVVAVAPTFGIDVPGGPEQPTLFDPRSQWDPTVTGNCGQSQVRIAPAMGAASGTASVSVWLNSFGGPIFSYDLLIWWVNWDKVIFGGQGAPFGFVPLSGTTNMSTVGPGVRISTGRGFVSVTVSGTVTLASGVTCTVLAPSSASLIT